VQALPSSAITAAPAVGACAVCWGAIFAGSAVVAAISLLLFALVSGVDLATLRWAGRPSEASAVALIATQWISACLGGYITGRLRTRWVGTHTHEVFFRDTAHGFITWCVATLVLATGAVSAAGLLGGSVRVGSAGAVRMPRTELSAGPWEAGGVGDWARAVEVRPRSDLVLPEGPSTPGVIELYRTAPTLLSPGPLSPAPLAAAPLAAAPLAAAPAGIANNGSQDSSPIHDAPITYDARSIAGWPVSDPERKEAAGIAIMTALSMLVGAFIASVSAAIGGRLRDLHP
jgi:hypothetical protein